MPKCLIAYFSQGGTTAQVAESIAAGLRTAEYQVDLFNTRDGPPPSPSSYDVLGVGSPVYWYRLPFSVADYVNRLPRLDGLSAFSFVLYGTYRGETGTTLRRALSQKGAREVGYFHCRGADYFWGYVRQGTLFSPGHPTAQELDQAKVFGREVAARVAGGSYARPEDDRPAKAIYRLERFLAGRWLGNHMYSRLFTVDKKECTRCGLCIKLCPSKNIAEGRDEYPVWGRNCLMCFTCEMKCPKDAVGSALDWFVFRPLLNYNIRRASKDPSLDHVRVTHSKGRTKTV
jgi:flavodoxin/ferredoxin